MDECQHTKHIRCVDESLPRDANWVEPVNGENCWHRCGITGETCTRPLNFHYCGVYENDRAEAAMARVKALEDAGGAVADALTEACKVLGEKNPRRTVPVLLVWDAVRKKHG